MKPRIVVVTLVQVVGLLCFSALRADTAAIGTSSTPVNQQPSEAELTKRFNAILDKELSGENVCVTISAARELNALMTTAAQKVVSARAFDRVNEAEENVRKLAKALLKNGTQAGQTRITSETIASLMASPTEPPDSAGGPNVRDLFCPLFPIC